jgi:hypothetical protein
MTLQTTDLGTYLTNPAATAGTQLAQSDPNASLGKYASTTPFVSGQAGALFATVTAAQATSGLTDHRCVAIRNLSATDTARNVAVFLDDPAGGATFDLGKDPVGVVAYNAVPAQGTSVANVLTAPAGVVFTRPTRASLLAIGDMAPGTACLVWVRRTVPPLTPGAEADICDFGVHAETA